MPAAVPQAQTSTASRFRSRIAQALRWAPPELRTKDAVELLLGTVARETALGKFPDRPKSGGTGLFQINPGTEADIWNRYLPKKPQLKKALMRATGVAGPNPDALTRNFPYAASIARLAYARAEDALPSRHDHSGMADYWKKHYNTAAGKGTPEGFLKMYYELVGGPEHDEARHRLWRE